MTGEIDSGVHLRVLGVPAAVRGGEGVVTVRAGHARVAFAMLTLERHRPLHREELADAIWADDPPPTWWSALRTALARVRAVLAAAGLPYETLAAEGGCYALRLPAAVTVDVEAARAALRRAAALLASGRAAPAATLAERAAATLAQPLLPGVEGEWVDAAREPLARDAVRAYDVLAAARAKSHDWAGVVTAADAVLARDPFREPAHARKVAAYLALGDRAGALLAYRRCRDLFVAELGIEPGPELAELAARAAGRARPA